jgi:hypothetical protein
MRSPIAKGTFAFEQDGRRYELELELMSDERFRVVEPAEKSGARPGGGGAKFFRPPTQGKRMPNGLWNSSVPLPGHEIIYAEGEVPRSGG